MHHLCQVAPEYFQLLIDEGADLIICAGTQFLGSAMPFVEANPDVYFHFTTSWPSHAPRPPNVAVSALAVFEASYLAGVVAGATSGNLCLLMPRPHPAAVAYANAFYVGARESNASSTLLVSYLDDQSPEYIPEWNDRLAAISLLDMGCDVIYTFNDRSPVEVFSAAGKYTVNYQQDYRSEFGESALTSVWAGSSRRLRCLCKGC